MKRTLTTIASLLTFAAPLAAQAEPATATSPTAVELYSGAAALLVVESPSASSGTFPDYPPMGDRWMKLAEAAWRQNADARDMARDANAAAIAGWPPGKDWTYLNKCRAVANELGDAAQYRGLSGDLPAALGFLNDLLDLGEKLRAPPLDERVFLHELVASGIDAVACDRAMIVAPALADAGDAPAADVARLIARLLTTPDVAAAIAVARTDPRGADRAILTFERILAERRMTAISLACQLYRRDKSAWPAKADDLVPAYLPSIPLDPADEKLPIGYALIAKGLPDGGDRPLVYSREESRDGLAYRTDEPQYAFYVFDGSSLPSRVQKRSGQFRDVARWAPATNPVPGAKAPLAGLENEERK